MKRYIDLTGQGTGYKFAWWDTGTDTFEQHSGNHAWDDWDEFANDYEGTELRRYRLLMPNSILDKTDPVSIARSLSPEGRDIHYLEGDEGINEARRILDEELIPGGSGYSLLSKAFAEWEGVTLESNVVEAVKALDAEINSAG